jgi:hypothetical protein
MNPETKNWLLNTKSPSLKYRLMTELLDIPITDNEAIKVKNEIINDSQVINILKKMHPEGYWFLKNSKTQKIVGDNVEYANFVTTHFCLSFLSELGLTKENQLVAKASERYLNLQKEDGDWHQHLSCLYGYNIRTFIKLGFRNDERLQKTINLMLETNRNDNGYLCDMHEKRSKRKKSCIRGTAKVLLAFSELPEYWEHPRCKLLIDYFLDREAIYKTTDKKMFVSKDINVTSFPIGWQVNLWEILYSLSKMGFGNDERLERAWKVLETKLDKEGRIKLDWTHPQSLWKVGKQKQDNEWLTFYVLLAKKYKDKSV